MTIPSDIELRLKNIKEAKKSENDRLTEESLAQVYDSVLPSEGFNREAFQELLIATSIQDAFPQSFLSRVATLVPKEVFDNSTWATSVYSTELSLSIPIKATDKADQIKEAALELNNYFITQYNKFFTDILESYPTEKVTASSLDLPVYSNLRQTLADKYVLPVTYFFMSTSLWYDVFGNTSLTKLLDPTTKHSDLIKGSLGKILSTDLVTDSFYHPTVKYFSRGEAIFTNLTNESVILHNLGTCSIDNVASTSSSVEVTATFSLEVKADSHNKFGSYLVKIL